MVRHNTGAPYLLTHTIFLSKASVTYDFMRISFALGCLLLAITTWRNRHFILALLLGLFSYIALIYFDAVRHWLARLGVDSFSEAQNFDLHEAWFLVSSLPSILIPMRWQKWFENASITTAAAILLVTALAWIFKSRTKAGNTGWWKYSITLPACVMIIAPILTEGQQISKSFRSNSKLYTSVQNNFANNLDAVEIKPLPNMGINGSSLNILVYIGESTTSMHWSMYGYPISTTPRLTEFAATHTGFLQFNNVISTHVHTSQSLLQALSFDVKGQDDYVQIFDRKRLPLLSVLAKQHIPTILLSTQGQSGTSNLASSIIFADVDNKKYSDTASKFISHHGAYLDKPDHEFFADAVQQLQILGATNKKPVVGFLHSYAGHGDYYQNLPENFRIPMDDFLEQTSSIDLWGTHVPKPSNNELAGYDAAMAYIDASVTSVMQQVEQTSRPTVFIYFPDHGEAPLTRAEHDSARFQHEMIRIPFIMYFNPPAQKAQPELFKLFKQAAETNRPSTLDQFSATIMTLLGYELTNAAHAYKGIGLDQESKLAPVVVRQVGDKTTFIKSNYHLDNTPASVQDVTDNATTIWLNSRQRNGYRETSRLCYEDANTWGKANRGAMVADCLAINLDAQADKTNTGLSDVMGGWTIAAASRIAQGHSLDLWLKTTRFPANLACAAVMSSFDHLLNSFDSPAKLILQVTPPAFTNQMQQSTSADFPAACHDLQNKGAIIFLTVPEQIAKQGTKKLTSWTRQLKSTGWPINYVFNGYSDNDVFLNLEIAAGNLAESVAIAGIKPENLFTVTDNHRPQFDWLLVDTSWDINSR